MHLLVSFNQVEHIQYFQQTVVSPVKLILLLMDEGLLEVLLVVKSVLELVEGLVVELLEVRKLLVSLLLVQKLRM